MKILITGCAGFIGFHVANKLLSDGNHVVGIDNINHYYDINLKHKRLEILKKKKNFIFKKIDIKNIKDLTKVFKKNNFQNVIHLAAQAGVRYSLKKPKFYIDTNILGFFNVLENCKKFNIARLLYASTSSVYGNQKKFPLKEENNTDNPLQLYAATKKSNEVMASAYSNLFELQTIGMRFFTVYGPWGRPDMALFNFTTNILRNKKIKIFNYGNHERDFTYIDDVVEIIARLNKANNLKKKNLILNIGNNNPIKLSKYISQIEKLLKKKAKKEFLPLQLGDTFKTHANSNKVFKIVKYKPKTNYLVGVKKFINWYRKYYKNDFKKN